MTGPLRVGLVDDQRMFADALRMLLESDDQIEVAWVAGEAQTGLRHIAEDRPDVVVMDVDLPGLDGITATKQIVAEDEQAKVVVLTALSDPDLVVRAIEAGACGFVTKHRAGDDLTNVVRAAADGDTAFHPNGIGQLFERIRTREPSPATTALSNREIEVLQGLTDGFSTEELAAALFVSRRTVQGHVQNILMKLGVRSKLEAVLQGLRHGIVRLRTDRGDGPASMQRIS